MALPFAVPQMPSPSSTHSPLSPTLSDALRASLEAQDVISPEELDEYFTGFLTPSDDLSSTSSPTESSLFSNGTSAVLVDALSNGSVRATRLSHEATHGQDLAPHESSDTLSPSSGSHKDSTPSATTTLPSALMPAPHPNMGSPDTASVGLAIPNSSSEVTRHENGSLRPITPEDEADPSELVALRHEMRALFTTAIAAHSERLHGELSALRNEVRELRLQAAQDQKDSRKRLDWIKCDVQDIVEVVEDLGVFRAQAQRLPALVDDIAELKRSVECLPDVLSGIEVLKVGMQAIITAQQKEKRREGPVPTHSEPQSPSSVNRRPRQAADTAASSPQPVVVRFSSPPVVAKAMPEQAKKPETRGSSAHSSNYLTTSQDLLSVPRTSSRNSLRTDVAVVDFRPGPYTAEQQRLHAYRRVSSPLSPASSTSFSHAPFVSQSSRLPSPYRPPPGPSFEESPFIRPQSLEPSRGRSPQPTLNSLSRTIWTREIGSVMAPSVPSNDQGAEYGELFRHTKSPIRSSLFGSRPQSEGSPSDDGGMMLPWKSPSTLFPLSHRTSPAPTMRLDTPDSIRYYHENMRHSTDNSSSSHAPTTNHAPDFDAYDIPSPRYPFRSSPPVLFGQPMISPLDINALPSTIDPSLLERPHSAQWPPRPATPHTGGCCEVVSESSSDISSDDGYGERAHIGLADRKLLENALARQVPNGVPPSLEASLTYGGVPASQLIVPQMEATPLELSPPRTVEIQSLPVETEPTYMESSVPALLSPNTLGLTVDDSSAGTLIEAPLQSSTRPATPDHERIQQLTTQLVEMQTTLSQLQSRMKSEPDLRPASSLGVPVIPGTPYLQSIPTTSDDPPYIPTYGANVPASPTPIIPIVPSPDMSSLGLAGQSTAMPTISRTDSNPYSYSSSLSNYDPGWTSRWPLNGERTERPRSPIAPISIPPIRMSEWPYVGNAPYGDQPYTAIPSASQEDRRSGSNRYLHRQTSAPFLQTKSSMTRRSMTDPSSWELSPASFPKTRAPHHAQNFFVPVAQAPPSHVATGMGRHTNIPPVNALHDPISPYDDPSWNSSSYARATQASVRREPPYPPPFSLSDTLHNVEASMAFQEDERLRHHAIPHMNRPYSPSPPSYPRPPMDSRSLSYLPHLPVSSRSYPSAPSYPYESLREYSSSRGYM